MADLTANFDVAEFQRASDRPLTAADIPNARELARKAEVIRREMDGVRLFMSSFVRVGSEGQHGNGTAGDFEFEAGHFTQRTLYDRVSALARAGGIGPFGQLIFYPFSDDHLHISLGTKREILIASADEKHYEPPTPALVAQIPGSVVLTAGGLLLVGAAFILLQGKRL